MEAMNRIEEEDIEAFVKSFPLAQKLQGKHFIITGATGLLGRCLTRCLMALRKQKDVDVSITAVVRNKDKAVSLFGEETAGLDYYVYDFSQGKPFCPAKGTSGLVVHFASPTASRYFIDNPVETMNTVYKGMDAILQYGHSAKVDSIVEVSTLEIYGTVLDDRHALKEEDQGFLDILSSRSSYPMAKRAAECLCLSYAKEYGVPVKIARLAQTFGAGVSKEDSRVFAQFARNIINHQPIVLHTRGELRRSYSYTIDAISAILYILLNGQNGEAYNVANDETYMSIMDMANYMCEHFGKASKPIVQLQDGLGYSPTTRLRLSTEKIRKLGWTPCYDKYTMFDRLIKSLKE